MLSLQQLQNIRQDSAAQVAALQSIFTRHSDEVASYRADGTRSSSFIAEQVKGARDKALADMGAIHPKLPENSRLATETKEFWDDKALVLSRLKFSTDPAVDAAMRAAKLAEYSRAEKPTRLIIARNALAERNLPELWIAYLADRGAAPTEGLEMVGLGEAEIPERTAALATIDEIKALEAQGEYLIAQTSGRATAVQKLALGRRMTAPHKEEPAKGYGSAA